MSGNSGFLGEQEDLTRVSASFGEAEILGHSATNVYGRVDRYSKRWFFKGVREEAPDAVPARQRLLKEFDIQVGLAHPGVERVVGFEEVEGLGQCIIAEWIEGDTLAEVMKEGTLTGAERDRILSEIVDAVGYIHSQGIVHRDLKPANIMIRKNGRSAVVIDFGLADTDTHLYQKSPAGTVGYASPRQHQAHNPYTGDDIHALGVIMMQLCPGLSSIARRCVSGRYADAGALREALRQRSRRRRMTVWGSVAMLFIITLAALFTYISSLRQTTADFADRIESMTDSIATLNTTSRTADLALRDSLATVSRELDKERTMRLDEERRRDRMEKLKEGLNRCLDTAYARFRSTEDPTDPDNQSMVRLIDLLAQAKRDFIAEAPLHLSDAESSELEYSFVLHYNEILQQWDKQLSRHRPARSPE